MATTVHLPPDLLESVDKQANSLGLSRNRFIIEALKKAIEAQVAWSSGFLQELSAAAHDEDGRDLIDQMIQAIAANRTRKTHPEL